jgi:hypothetical protein
MTSLGIQVQSSMDDLMAASSSFVASAGVLDPSVLRGRSFIRQAELFRVVCLRLLRSVPFGKNWRGSSLLFSF